MKILYIIIIFILGTAIGSFINVLIYRLPRGISIIKPNSFCPHCKKSILWYENIPIVSFLSLGGRCSRCKKTISLHYPLVELLTGILFLWSFLKYGFSLNLILVLLFFIFLIIISGIDYTFQLIPDILSIPGIILGLIFQMLNRNFYSGLAGMFFGGALILLIRILGGRIYKKEVMGMGDVYLTAMLGSYTGFPMVIPAIFIAALVGSCFGIIYLAITHQDKDKPIPFGPFLSIGGAVTFMFALSIQGFLRTIGISF
ncbi:MAG: prepilin peptidase [candidate division WOR-3 bacterium]